MGAHPVARSPLLRRCAAAAAAALTAGGLLTVSGSAGAQPQPTISQVKAKLNKLTYKENWLTQRYDRMTEDLAAARQQLSLVGHEVTRDKAQVRAMHTQIAQMASTAYENGSLTSEAALLTSANPRVILSQSAILVHLSTSRQQQLSSFLTAYHELTGAQQMAKRTKAGIAKLRTKLAAQKRSLDQLIAQQRTLLASLTAQQQAALIGAGGGSGGTYKGPTTTQAEKAVAFAYQQLGCPYVYGGTGPCGSGFDCSGLTQAAWAAAGVQIPRDSYSQASGLPAVSVHSLQPGDILLFAGASHVGLYVGGGYLIDAPRTGLNVEKVSLSSSWYAQNLYGAVRP